MATSTEPAFQNHGASKSPVVVTVPSAFPLEQQLASCVPSSHHELEAALKTQATTAAPSSSVRASPSVLEAQLKPRVRKSSGIEKQVSFSSTLRIRTHNITVGDHPCCRDGMALTSDWSHDEEDEIVDLELYESSSLKRRQGALRLTFAQRRDRLQASKGLSGSELWQQEYEISFGCPLTITTGKLHTSPSVRRALAAALGLSKSSELVQ